MKKSDDKKSLKIKATVFTALIIISIVHIFILFRFICIDAVEALLWGAAVSLLIGGLILWIIKVKEIITEKQKRYLLSLRIIYTGLGGILFIVNSFVFINKITISCLLIITVFLIFISVCLASKLSKSKNNETILSSDCKIDGEKLDNKND